MKLLLIFAVRPRSVKPLFLPSWCELSAHTRVASLATALSHESDLVPRKSHSCVWTSGCECCYLVFQLNWFHLQYALSAFIC